MRAPPSIFLDVIAEQPADVRHESLLAFVEFTRVAAVIEDELLERGRVLHESVRRSDQRLVMPDLALAERLVRIVGRYQLVRADASHTTPGGGGSGFARARAALVAR